MKLTSVFTLAAVAAATVMFSPSAVRGQGVGDLDDTRTNSRFYYHVEPGAPRIEVRVIGTVESPGIYHVSDRTDVGKLLVLAGGPLNMGSAAGRPDVTLRLYRATNGTRSLVYESSLKDHLRAVQAYPVLDENDVLMVETRVRRGFGWRDALSVLTTVATVGLLVNRWSE